MKEIGEQNRPTTLSMSKSSDNLLKLTNTSAFDRIKRYLEEKEIHIFKKVHLCLLLVTGGKIDPIKNPKSTLRND